MCVLAISRILGMMGMGAQLEGWKITPGILAHKQAYQKQWQCKQK
jgi:hypothetical protein